MALTFPNLGDDEERKVVRSSVALRIPVPGPSPGCDPGDTLDHDPELARFVDYCRQRKVIAMEIVIHTSNRKML